MATTAKSAGCLFQIQAKVIRGRARDANRNSETRKESSDDEGDPDSRAG
jgi:hypothetical protein